MKKIYNWKAKRSGAAISIEGLTAEGIRIKVTSIETIEASGTGIDPIAIGRRGDRFILCGGTRRDPEAVLNRLSEESRRYVPTA